jgi:homoserine dehydrogenase
VNRTLVRLLRAKEKDLATRGIGWRITGVASRRKGWIADEKGIDVEHLTEPTTAIANVCDWLTVARPDVVFEATSLSVGDGQPAIEHIRAALESGAHAITANKGPIVYAYEELRELALAKKRKFLYESTVMDGVPIFSMFRDGLPLIQLKGFRGILNSTTNVILTGMESGLTFEDSLKQAQKLGIAETDPTHDIEGWDAAVKTAVLVRVLMGAPIKLGDVRREGIERIAGDAVRAAREQGKAYKLVCRAWQNGGRAVASVGPEQVSLSDPLAWVTGTSSILQLDTDIFPQLTLTEINPGLEATAYGMLADFVRAVS